MTEPAPEQPTETSKPAPSLGARILHNWVLPFLIVLAVLSPIRSVIADWYDVPTGSMEPTILVGDRIAANKLAFGLRIPFTMKWLARWDEPQQGEVVILHSPADGTRMVKRVIAGPGDTISLVRNRVHINDVETTYEPLTQAELDTLPPEFIGTHEFATEKLATGDHTIMLTPNRAAMRTYGPVTVPEHQYFVMGDNRDNSGDSRVFGFVDRDLIVGRSSYVVLSVDRNNYYKPRFDRFFHPLD